MGLMLTPGGRVFDTRTGRFLSRDPIRVHGENPYAALTCNPLNVVDPDGLLRMSAAVQANPQYVALLRELERTARNLIIAYLQDIIREETRISDIRVTITALTPGRGPEFDIIEGSGEPYFLQAGQERKVQIVVEKPRGPRGVKEKVDKKVTGKEPFGTLLFPKCFLDNVIRERDPKVKEGLKRRVVKSLIHEIVHWTEWQQLLNFYKKQELHRMRMSEPAAEAVTEELEKHYPTGGF